jgi:predicted transcriptional regulator
MTARPRSKIDTEAAELDPAYEVAIEEARAQVDAGKTHSYAEVRRWLLSLGTKKKLPRPRCK